MKNRTQKIGIVLITIFLNFISIQGRAMTITVFTDRQHPVSSSTNEPIRYYQVDDTRLLLNGLNQDIQGLSPSMALEKARQWLKDNRLSLKKMGQGIEAMHRYHIHQIPTIVFDDNRYQIAGQTDLQVAICEYKTWRKTHE